MPELISKAIKGVLVKMAVARGLLYSIAAFWTCWQTATNNVDIGNMAGWDWFQTIGGCTAAWILVMVAFLDKSAQQLAEGKLPGFEDISIPMDQVNLVKGMVAKVQAEQASVVPATPPPTP